MKNTFGGRFYFFQARRGAPTSVRPATHSLIIDQLVGEGWFSYGTQDATQRELPSSPVRLNEDLRALAVDVHPGLATVAILDLHGRMGYGKVERCRGRRLGIWRCPKALNQLRALGGETIIGSNIDTAMMPAMIWRELA